MAVIIELKQVSFSAQQKTIVQDLSYQFEEGKTTALAGPSGGGKSTALKLSAGLLVPSKGKVCFRGQDVSLMNREQNLVFRREGAVVFQDSALWANQNLDQILELPLRIHFPSMTKTERNHRIREVLTEVGYKKELEIRPAQLSMGEQKLIAFARAMLCRPRLLFLDEWTESLDDTAAHRLISLVKRMQEAGHTIILVTHNLNLIMSLADYMLVIRGGALSLRLTKAEMNSDEDLIRSIEQEINL
ncbi:MAG: ATP-binding cassette domain-containing protein [Treponema sp.]|jgi:ABC-type multidrug transport system ATPase subunit|nr:ATP-binding cassette domain-containing protein [Treponema sp.]